MKNTANHCFIRATLTHRLAGCIPALALALVPASQHALAQQPAGPPGNPAIESAAAETQAGVMKLLQGQVRVAAKDGTVRPAVSGEQLHATDRIVTGAASGVSVVLRDGTTLVLGPSSRADLKSFDFNSTTQEGSLVVALLEGSMRMMSGLIGKLHPESVRIETRTALIGVRGTDFIVEADAPWWEAKP